MTMLRTSLLPAICLLSNLLMGQEICNNGIDDDGNGLIDLNDPSCPCSGLLSGTPSFIPNPSFEDLDTNWLYVPQLDTTVFISVCCPSYFGDIDEQLACLRHWERATNLSTDFFHPCGDIYPTVFPPPPDGVGFVGMRIDNVEQDFVGMCLMAQSPPNPLQAGVEYALTAHVAGTSVQYGMAQSMGAYYTDPIPLALYGRGDCVPFPVDTWGCPVQNGWVVLATLDHQANGEWNQVTLHFTPDQEIHTIMFGTACEVPAFEGGGPNYVPYMLLDDLHLTEAVHQVTLPVTSTGHICTNNMLVTAHPPSGATGYQWYLDGVALIGQTGLVLNVSELGLSGGHYTLSCTYQGECLMGSTHVVVPNGPAPLAHISPATGCVPLSVVFSDGTDPEPMSSTWSFGDGGSALGTTVMHTYTAPGIYDVGLSITTEMGCVHDSTYVGAVLVHPGPIGSITASPNPVEMEDPVTMLNSSGSSGDILSWSWDLGSATPASASTPSLTATFPAVPGSYPVVLMVTTTAGCMDTVHSMVVVRSNKLEMPNTFSPNGDGHNDRFVPLEYGGAPAVLEIYNRWGQLIFSTTKLTIGWDGRAAGRDVPEGTYYYVVRPDDTQSEALTGHLTLVR